MLIEYVFFVFVDPYISPLFSVLSIISPHQFPEQRLATFFKLYTQYYVSPNFRVTRMF